MSVIHGHTCIGNDGGITSRRCLACEKEVLSGTVFAWRCRSCGCLWRDNRDGTVSLFGPQSKSCVECEHKGTHAACEPLPLIETVEAYTRRAFDAEHALGAAVERLRALLAGLRSLQCRPGCWCGDAPNHTHFCQEIRGIMATLAVGWIVTVRLSPFNYVTAGDGSTIGINRPHVFPKREEADKCAHSLARLGAEVVPWNAVHPDVQP